MIKRHGFSLAEMMIVMLMVAVVLAATAPMITRRISRERSDKIFDMLNTDPANAVEYVKGRNQRIYMNAKSNGYVGITETGKEIGNNSVILGYQKTPTGISKPQYTIAIGFNTTSNTGSVAVGSNSSASKYSVAVGNFADGQDASTNFVQTGYSVAVGYGASGYKRSTAIGANSNARESSVAIGYNANATGTSSIVIGKNAQTYSTSTKNAIAIGYGAKAISNSVAIGYNANAENNHTIVLGTKDDTVYIPGNIVVDHAALIGRAAGRNDNLYFRPYAQEDGRHFAVFNAGDWKGEDSNLALTQYCENTDLLGVKVGPFITNPEGWKRDYKDNNRAHICFDDPTRGDNPGIYKYSDIRLKNIVSPYNSGLAEIEKINVYNYTYKNDNDKKPQVGVIAQDLKKIFPASIKEDSKGYLKIRWDEMFYAAINAIKELNNKVENIAKNVQTITKDIVTLKTVTEKQQAKIEAQAKTLAEQQKELKLLTKRVEKLEQKK